MAKPERFLVIIANGIEDLGTYQRSTEVIEAFGLGTNGYEIDRFDSHPIGRLMLETFRGNGHAAPR